MSIGLVLSKQIMLFFLLFILIFYSVSLSSATISGIVTNKNNGQPIEYASVIIKGKSQGAYTNNKGYFVITDIIPGKYIIFASQTSYAVSESNVVVKNIKEDIYLKIELSQKTIAMEDVTVSASSIDNDINSREIVVSKVIRNTKQLLDVVQVAEPDVFRSMLTLPGVTPIADFSSGMYIRGGSPDQNQILLDDIDVYNPSHFGGLFSTFNTDAIESVELLKGGFPAKYGGRLSSVLDVRNRDGNRKHHQGIARLSLISLSATMEGPWTLGKENGAYMCSFRRSYLDLMRKAISEIPNYYFYDGHLKLNWDIDRKNKLMVSTYFGYDKLDMDMGSDFMIGWGNNTVTSQWVHIFNPQLFSHFVIAGSHFESLMEMSDSDNNFKRINNIDDLSIKAMMSYKPNNYHMIEYGIETKYNTIEFKNETNMDIAEERMPNILANSITSDLYLQDTWSINPFWTLQSGIRVSNYKTLDVNLQSSPPATYWKFSPRVSLRKELSISSNVFVSYGRYYQFLTLISPGMSTPLDIWFPIDKTVKPGISDHYIFGYKNQFNEGLGLDIELFYKDMDNLVEYRWETEEEWNNDTMTLKDVFHIGKGDAKGIEVLLKTDKWGWSGFIGYSYSVTRKKLADYNLNPQTHSPEYFYPKYDRNHQVNIVQTYNLTEQTGKQLWGADILFGITYAFATGQPTQIPEKIYYSNEQVDFMYSYSDSRRLPNYSRLDLSYKMQWHKEKYTIEPYLQIINFTNNTNVFDRSYYIEFVEGNMVLKYEDTNQFPLIPFIGVNVNW
ncbi:MAG: TonB-dependent receptor [Candidatus Cloacimonetes bacterium]|nr:TonB-dependent receptor [Candidatus Cloacimonadota bacterium]